MNYISNFLDAYIWYLVLHYILFGVSLYV